MNQICFSAFKIVLRRSWKTGWLHDTDKCLLRRVFCRKHRLRKIAKSKIDSVIVNTQARTLNSGHILKEKDRYNSVVGGPNIYDFFNLLDSKAWNMEETLSPFTEGENKFRYVCNVTVQTCYSSGWTLLSSLVISEGATDLLASYVFLISEHRTFSCDNSSSEGYS
jgi:hypothetical protein